MGILSWWLESLDYQVRISTACLRNRSPHSQCKTCIYACSKSAITITGRIAEIDANLCDGCGECLASCPVHAIEGILPKRAVVGTALLFSESYVPSETELLVFYAKGIRTIAVLDGSLNSGLNGNLNGILNEGWELVVEQANHMLEQMNLPPFQIEKKTPDQIEKRYTRRQLFSLWKHQGKTVITELMPAKWRFNERDLDLTIYYPNHQFFSIEIDSERCTLCKACTFICPNQCIQISSVKMSLDSAKCQNCSLCADICPERAVAVWPQVSTKCIRELDIVEKTCTECSNSFSTFDAIASRCVICERQRRGIKK